MTNGEPMNLDNYLRVKLMTIASAEPRYHDIEWAKAHAAENDNRVWLKWKEAIDQHDQLRAELAKAKEMLADVRDNHQHAIHWEDLHLVMARVREWLERNP